VQISSELDFERVDRLRAQSDAVMVGGRTLIENDPRLTIKSPELRAERRNKKREENPIKVGIITNAVLPPDSRFLTFGPARKMIFTTTQTKASDIGLLRQLDMQVFVTEGDRVDLPSALQQLKRSGVQNLLVEGGGILNEELIKYGLVDEINLYIAPLIFGGANAPTFVSGAGLERKNAIRLQLTSIEKQDDGGVLLKYLVMKSAHISIDDNQGE
jgi:2,5-diamino-6-(ribosylamino)-4(3H)-pyrimidinone 5'-phosphate reductase